MADTYDLDNRYEEDEDEDYHGRNGYGEVNGDDDDVNNNDGANHKVDPKKLMEMAYQDVPNAKSRDPNARRGQVKVAVTGGGDFKGLQVNDEKVSDFKSVLRNKNISPDKPSKVASDKPEWAGQARRIDVARLETQRKKDEPGEKTLEWAGKLKSTGRIAELETRKPTQSSPSTPPWANLANKSRKLPDAELKGKPGQSDTPEWAGRPQLRTVKSEPKRKTSEEKPAFAKTALKKVASVEPGKPEDRNSEESPPHHSSEPDPEDKADESEPEPLREPSPEPVREPTPEPEPVRKAVRQPVREPSPEPEPVSKPARQPSPEPQEEAPVRRSQRSRPIEEDGDDDSTSRSSRRSRRARENEAEQEDTSSRSRRTPVRAKEEESQEEEDDAAARRRARRARRRGGDDDE